jgi:hypothetical protein
MPRKRARLRSLKSPLWIRWRAISSKLELIRSNDILLTLGYFILK